MTTDATLLNRYAATRDAVAFAELAKRYRAMVFAVGKRTTGSHHDAEDVTQGCFMDLARNAGRIVNGQCLAGWLYSAATRRAIRASQSKRRQAQIEQEAIAQRPEASGEGKWDDLSPLIDLAIAELPPELRDPLVLYFFQERSQAEIAAELKCSRTAIARRIEKGISHLRKKVDRSGVVASAAVLVLLLKQNAFASEVPTAVRGHLARMALYGPVSTPVQSASLWQSILAAVHGVSWRTFGFATIGVLLTCIELASFRKALTPLPHTYDQLEQFYGQPLGRGFDRRIASASRDLRSFWRGSQPLFYGWCRENAADWLERGPNVLSPATPVLTDAATLPREVDVANSARVPFQLELLQAMVSARVQMGVIDDPARFDVDRELFHAYRQAIAKHPPTAWKEAPGGPAGQAELDRYVDPSGRLRPVVLTAKGKIAETLSKTVDRREVVRAIGEAMRNNPGLLRDLPRDTRQLHSMVIDAAERNRLYASASQGLTSLLVLIRTPSVESSGLRLIELHQVMSAAAESGGAIPADLRQPGRRAAEDEMALAALCSPRSWCMYQSRSMYVRVHEQSIDTSVLFGMALLHHWAETIGAIHGRQPGCPAIAAAMDDELLRTLTRRADAFTHQLIKDFDDLSGDRRSTAAQATVKAQTSETVSSAVNTDVRP